MAVTRTIRYRAVRPSASVPRLLIGDLGPEFLAQNEAIILAHQRRIAAEEPRSEVARREVLCHARPNPGYTGQPTHCRLCPPDVEKPLTAEFFAEMATGGVNELCRFCQQREYGIAWRKRKKAKRSG